MSSSSDGHKGGAAGCSGRSRSWSNDAHFETGIPMRPKQGKLKQSSLTLYFAMASSSSLSMEWRGIEVRSREARLTT